MKKLCLSTIWKSSRNAATCRAVRHRQCGRDACQRSSNEIMMRNCYMQQGASWDMQEHFVLWIFWNSGACLEHVTCWNSLWDRKILEDSNLNSQPGAEQLHASSWRPAASSTTHAAETKAAKFYCRMLQIYHDISDFSADFQVTVFCPFCSFIYETSAHIHTCKMTKQSKPPLSFADDLCQEGERRGGAPRFRGEGRHNAEVSGKSHRQPAWFKQFGSKVSFEFRWYPKRTLSPLTTVKDASERQSPRA